MDDDKAEGLAAYCKEHEVEVVRMVPSAKQFAMEECVLVPSGHGM